MKLEKIDLSDVDSYACISVKHLDDGMVKICKEVVADFSDMVDMITSFVSSVIEDDDVTDEGVNALYKEIGKCFNVKIKRENKDEVS